MYSIKYTYTVARECDFSVHDSHTLKRQLRSANTSLPTKKLNWCLANIEAALLKSVE